MRELLYLKDENIKDFIEQIFYVYRETYSDPKKVLKKYSFGSAHHRVIILVERNNGITISGLLNKLKITKQSLNRILKDLIKNNSIIINNAWTCVIQQLYWSFRDINKWNNFLKQKNVHIIDVRKSFEYDVGTFVGAKNPNLDNFRDFPKYFKKFNKKNTIAMFCTGGVRCEKASSYLKRKGFNNVFQLKGGILNYLKNIGKNLSMWKGECYVFDNRVSLKHKLKIGTYSICSGCRKPISLNEKKSEKYFEGVSCPKCHDKLSVSQKERFMMRQKQIIDAKKLGKNYFFKKEYQWVLIGK